MKTTVLPIQRYGTAQKLLLIFFILMILSIESAYGQPYKADLPSGSLGLRLNATQGGGNSPYILFDARNADSGASSVFLQRQEGNSLVFRRYNNTNPLSDQRLLMKMVNNGNIGVLTNSPQERFHVNGNVRSDREFIARGKNGQANFHSRFGSDGVNHRIELRTGDTPYIDFSNNVANTADADFDARIILENENVLGIRGARLAIGDVDAPIGFPLAVDGRVLATGMKIQTVDNWPDYVFEADYQLRPLSEVEAFIKANKHLPEIPSAEQVAAEDGFDVATINKALLEKVEELTLYTIAQEKQLAIQQERLTALAAKVDQLISKK